MESIFITKDKIINKFMDNLLSVVAKHADIDTRRAMGFPPRKLSPEWKDFCPRPYGPHIFKYFCNKKVLLYYEFWEYDYLYSEVTRGIIPRCPVERRWRYLSGSKIYGMMHTDKTTEVYKSRFSCH